MRPPIPFRSLAPPLFTPALCAALLLGHGLFAPLALAAKPPAPAPTTQTAPAPPSVRATAAIDWAPVDERIARGDWQGAAADIEAVLADPARASQQAAAWARLGRALDAGRLPYAALVAWSRALELSPTDASADYGAILTRAEELTEQVWMGGLLGKDFSVTMEEDVRSHVAWLAAKHHFAEGSWGLALGLLPLVGEGHPWTLDAQVLRGITLAQQSQYQDAIDVLMGARDWARGRDDHYQNMLDLNIARTYYALAKDDRGLLGRAMEYYGKVDREDPAWPEAHFERAWAHFRADDMPGTLALLQTHTSPFFEEWYFPEAHLLRAQALFLMCKFPSTTEAIDTFQAEYQPVLAQLRAALVDLDAAGAEADAKAAVDGGTTKLPRGLLRRLEWDERFTGALRAITAADEELSRLKGVSAPWSARLQPLLQARREARVIEEGTRVLEWSRTAEADLAGMLLDIELTRVDLLSFQADMYQRAAVTGVAPDLGDPIGQLRKEQKRKGKQIWPFEGEFWADELGYFKISARSECPAEMQRGE